MKINYTSRFIMPSSVTKGFTLLELLVVMAVISALATVLIFAINPVEIGRRSRDSKRLADLGTLKSSIDLALSDGQVLSPTSDWLDITVATLASNFDGNGLDLSKYMSAISQNPGGNTQYVNDDCTVSSATSDDMKYQYKSDGDNYVLRARMESLTSCDSVRYDGNNAGAYYHLGTDPGLDL